jgi:hypothetical protein
MPDHANDDYFAFDEELEQKDDSFEDLFAEAIGNRNNNFESPPRKQPRTSGTTTDDFVCLPNSKADNEK